MIEDQNWAKNKIGSKITIGSKLNFGQKITFYKIGFKQGLNSSRSCLDHP